MNAIRLFNSFEVPTYPPWLKCALQLTNKKVFMCGLTSIWKFNLSQMLRSFPVSFILFRVSAAYLTSLSNCCVFFVSLWFWKLLLHVLLQICFIIEQVFFLWTWAWSVCVFSSVYKLNRRVKIFGNGIFHRYFVISFPQLFVVFFRLVKASIRL